MNKTTILATATAALVGAGTAAGAGALAAPSTQRCPSTSKQVRTVRQDVRAAVKKARQSAFTGADRVAAARPILDQAVADGKLKAAVEKKMLARIEQGGRRQRRRP